MDPQEGSKFVGLDRDGRPFDPYDGRWSTQHTTGPDRLVVAPAHGRHVDVLLALSRAVPDPFHILYLLLLSRRGEHPTGRYLSPAPSDREVTEAFLNRFRDYLEGDGRHQLWLIAEPSRETLVYDHHDLLYAYGPLDRFKAVLSGFGLREAPVSVPAPHRHGYAEAFDDRERQILSYWDWSHSPLRPGDDP